MANQGHEVPPIHCYTNPSFLPEHNNDDCNDLPPPPFPADDLPPPPPVALHPGTPTQQSYIQQQKLLLQQQQQQQVDSYARLNGSIHGHTNAAYRNTEGEFPEKRANEFFQPIQPVPQTANHSFGFMTQQEDDIANGNQVSGFQRNRYASLPVRQARMFAHRNEQAARYEQIRDDLDIIQRRREASRFELIEHQQVQQRAAPTPLELQLQQLPQQQHSTSQPKQQQQPQFNSPRNPQKIGNGQFPSLQIQDQRWIEEQGSDWEKETSGRKIISTPKGCYASLPMQDDDPPLLPDRNVTETSLNRMPSNAAATQKLHEILTTPRKPRVRSLSQTLSPTKLQQPMLHNFQPAQRNAMTPGSSPSGRLIRSPSQHSTPQSRALSPRRGPMTSTPTKESPAARRCLPLHEPATAQSFRKSTSNLNSSQMRYYESQAEENLTAMYIGRSQSFRETPSALERKNASYYQSVESAFVGRTAVVPPLSPQMSDANSTLTSGTDKSERRSAPVLLFLVGLLTCGLAVYLSYIKGRSYYYDSAIICGACCALAGASRSLRRTWTGLGLAGLASLTCGGLLVIAVKSPKPGTPLHDFTAGVLCGVSLLGAFLAVLALFSPRISLSRHRRVHSWIPRFSP